MSAIVGVLVGRSASIPYGPVRLPECGSRHDEAAADIATPGRRDGHDRRCPAIPRWEFVVLVGCAAAILVVVGLAGNKVNGAKYPHLVVTVDRALMARHAPARACSGEARIQI